VRVNVDFAENQYKPAPSRSRRGHRADFDALKAQIEQLQAEVTKLETEKGDLLRTVQTRSPHKCCSTPSRAETYRNSSLAGLAHAVVAIVRGAGEPMSIESLTYADLVGRCGLVHARNPPDARPRWPQWLSL
jgi:hypothetical protein